MNAVTRFVKKLWARDTVQRTVHAFWQAASAVLVGEFTGSGLNIAHLANWSVDTKILTAALMAGGTAVLAALHGATRTALVNRKTAASTADDLFTMSDAVDPLADVLDPNTPGASRPTTPTSPATP